MKPLILKFVENRIIEEFCLDYQYDYRSSLNIIKIEDKQIPLISLDSEMLDIKTQTRHQMEGLDVGNDLVNIKIITKAERDEVQNICSFRMESRIKTYVSRERDDENFINLQ